MADVLEFEFTYSRLYVMPPAPLFPKGTEEMVAALTQRIDGAAGLYETPLPGIWPLEE